MKELQAFQCDDCGTEFEYSPAADGSVPDGCPECASGEVERT